VVAEGEGGPGRCGAVAVPCEARRARKYKSGTVQHADRGSGGTRVPRSGKAGRGCDERRGNLRAVHENPPGGEGRNLDSRAAASDSASSGPRTAARGAGSRGEEAEGRD